MSNLFLKILNMSISASWLVLAVLILRFVLKKAPKWVNVLLWGIVAVRLICPFTIESSVSLIPDSVGSGELVSEWIDDYIDDIDIHHPDSVYYDAAIGAGREPISDGEGGYYVVTKHDQLGEPATIENTVIPVLSIVWVTGMAILALYTVISYFRLRRKVDTAIRNKDNIFQSENVNSPFVLGILRPRIYLPFKMNGQDLGHVVAHEQSHICRKDHWWKPLGFLLLTIHWFNPLMWLAYIFLCRDIELACDEKVIQALGNEQRADYSQALLACSVNHRRIAACPLAFGEVGVKERVKSVMNYKKPAFWVVILAVISCVIVAVCFLTNPRQDSFTIGITVPAGSQEAVVYADEEISPLGNSITVTAGDGLGDTQVYLKTVEVQTETAYDEPAYLTPGMPVKMDVEQGGWFKIGVSVQNETDEDIVVYINVKNVTVRIPSAEAIDRAQYYTPFIGDGPKVSAIAQILPYPAGYTYSSIALQTDTQPYGLTVYLKGKGTELEKYFENCAVEAFDLIGNLDIVSFCKEGNETPMATFARTDYEKQAKYYLIIGAEGVTSIGFSKPGFSGGCQPADGNPFPKGERVWLQALDGFEDLRGLKITALDEKGETVWMASIPDTEENEGFTHLTSDGWTVYAE